MSASDSVRVVPVPLQMVPEMWEAVLPHLTRGDQVARSNPVKLLLDLVSGHAVLWCVFVSDELVAAFFTSVVLEDDGRKSLMVYGLGGGRLRVWVDGALATLEAHARGNGCFAQCFYGRRGWSRVVPHYQSTPAGDGVALYQKVLS